MPKATGVHRDLKVQRLKAAIGAIPLLADRDPLISDPEFDAWRAGAAQSLVDVFAESNMVGYSRRFAKIHFRSTIRQGGRFREVVFKADYRKVWTEGLQRAEGVLREAIEEAELGPVIVAEHVGQFPVSEQPIVINVHNAISNAFSPTVHVTFSQNRC